MAKVYTKEELNSFSRETLMAVILSMQDQISQLKEYSFIDDILPWSEKLPEICRSKTKTINI